jgi:Ion channel
VRYIAIGFGALSLPPTACQTMKDADPILLFIPVLVGAAAAVCTILIHALPLNATITFLRREKKLGHLALNFHRDMWVVVRVILYAFVAHLVEIALWAALFMLCGEFSNFGTAYYHSAVNYTSLGYGDIIMTPAWRMLAPVETASGMLLFGVSTAMTFAVIQRLVEARFAELKN